jgi:hypothetical protein
MALTWESAPGLKYAVEWTTNSASSNAWAAFGSPFTASTNTTSYTNPPPLPDPQRFYRIRKDP